MTDRSFSHPCPRPSTAADLPTEFEGTWITPRNTRWIFHAEGFVEDHFLPNEYLAQLDANDKLHLFFDGEEDVFDRTEGTPGQVEGKWNSLGERMQKSNCSGSQMFGMVNELLEFRQILSPLTVFFLKKYPL